MSADLDRFLKDEATDIDRALVAVRYSTFPALFSLADDVTVIEIGACLGGSNCSWRCSNRVSRKTPVGSDSVK
jgi:hypothetical protein